MWGCPGSIGGLALALMASAVADDNATTMVPTALPPNFYPNELNGSTCFAASYHEVARGIRASR